MSVVSDNRPSRIRPDSTPGGCDRSILDSDVSLGSVSTHEAGIQPQGCCGVEVGAPLVGCHCLGVDLPFC